MEQVSHQQTFIDTVNDDIENMTAEKYFANKLYQVGIPIIMHIQIQEI